MYIVLLPATYNLLYTVPPIFWSFTLKVAMYVPVSRGVKDIRTDVWPLRDVDGSLILFISLCVLSWTILYIKWSFRNVYGVPLRQTNCKYEKKNNKKPRVIDMKGITIKITHLIYLQ